MTEKQSSDTKPKMGAPTKNPEDVNPNWQEAMKVAYSEGKSDTWVRARVLNAISRDLWYRWMEEDKDFSDSVKQGRELSQAWWEDVSVDHAVGSNTDANATSLIFNMSNRFKDDWKQRQSVEQTTTHVMEFEDLKKTEQFLIDNGIDPSSIE